MRDTHMHTHTLTHSLTAPSAHRPACRKPCHYCGLDVVSGWYGGFSLLCHYSETFTLPLSRPFPLLPDPSPFFFSALTKPPFTFSRLCRTERVFSWVWKPHLALHYVISQGASCLKCSCQQTTVPSLDCKSNPEPVLAQAWQWLRVILNGTFYS